MGDVNIYNTHGPLPKQDFDTMPQGEVDELVEDVLSKPEQVEGKYYQPIRKILIDWENNHRTAEALCDAFDRSLYKVMCLYKNLEETRARVEDFLNT